MTDKNGAEGEDLTARHYESLGFKIIKRNYIPPKGRATGEIDLIATKGKLLVFIEVKTRNNESFGSATEAVDRSKQRKIVVTSKMFVSYNPQYKDFDLRIDVSEVHIDKGRGSVKIIEDAIEDMN
ncbi:MAG: YraN family protein [Acidobacteriaceae bacterium]